MVVEDLGKKINAIEESIKVLEEKEHESVKKIELLLTEKLETLQNTVGVLKKCLAEKDEYIVNVDKD